MVEIRNVRPGKDIWLYIRMLADGSLKYALYNESADTTAEDLRKPALMRWSIEQSFHECKEYLGMDHYVEFVKRTQIHFVVLFNHSQV